MDVEINGTCGRLDSTVLALKIQEGTTDQGMRNTSRIWKRTRNRFSLRASRKEYSLAEHLNLSLLRTLLVRFLNLQNYKKIN